MTSSAVEGLIIRSAVAADAARIAELSGLLGYPIPHEAAVSRVEHVLARSGHVLLVAERPSDGVVGWIHAAEQELIEAGRRCEILGLIVAAGQREQGIGRRLVARVECWASERGFKELSVRSNIIRTESHPFYQRLGYTRGKTQHVYRKTI